MTVRVPAGTSYTLKKLIALARRPSKPNRFAVVRAYLPSTDNRWHSLRHAKTRSRSLFSMLLGNLPNVIKVGGNSILRGKLDV